MRTRMLLEVMFTLGGLGLGAQTPPRIERLNYLLSITKVQQPTLSDPEMLSSAQEAVALAEALNLKGRKVQALRSLSFAWSRNKVPSQALEASYQARELALNLGNDALGASIELEIGDIFQYGLSDFPTALAYYRMAFQRAEAAASEHWMVKAQSHMGDVYTHLGAYPTATQHLMKGLRLCERPREYYTRMARGVILVNLSQIDVAMGDLEEAERHLGQAEVIFAEPGGYETYGRSRIQIQRGNILRQRGDLPAALLEYRRALEIRSKRTNLSEIAALHHLIGDAERERGALDLALDHLRQALELRRKDSEALGLAETTCALGRLLLQQGKPQEALPHLEESLRVSEANAYNKQRTAAYLALADTHAALGNLDRSKSYRSLHHTWKDQIQGSMVTATVRSLMTRYERDHLDRALRTLRDRFSRTRILVLAGLGGMGLVGVDPLPERPHLVLWMRERSLGETALRIQLSQLQADRQGEVDPPAEPVKKYAASRLTDDLAQSYIRRIHQLFEEEHLHRDPELTLDRLAERLNLSGTYLSQIFNQYLETRFIDFLNAHRVREASQALRNPANQERSASDLGFEAGFNSKSNFYKIFKQATGCTPLEYRKQGGPS